MTRALIINTLDLNTHRTNKDLLIKLPIAYAILYSTAFWFVSRSNELNPAVNYRMSKIDWQENNQSVINFF